MTDNKTVLQALALIEQETETPRRISSLFKKSCFANNVVTTKVLIDLLFKELTVSLSDNGLYWSDVATVERSFQR